MAGGFGNTAYAQGAMVTGGENNQAEGVDSFAAGTGALAYSDHSFVWSDGTVPGGFQSIGPNQFLINASGGVGIGENAPRAAVGIGYATTNTPQVEITQFNSSDYARFRMDVWNYPPNPSWEMDVTPGATPSLQFWNTTLRMAVDYNGNVSATSFNPSSDRNAKENFSPVDVVEVLGKVAALPITRWNFKQDAGTPHIGPTAQDFHAAFGLGPDDKHIPTVDADGVALAAIQGLNQKLTDELKQKETEITELNRKNRLLEKRLNTLEKIVLDHASPHY